MKKLVLLTLFAMTLSTFAHAGPSEIVVEYAPFTIKEGITQDQLIAASDDFQKHFADQQSGFIKRELLHLEGRNWVDIVYWASKEDANNALKAAETSASCGKYFSIMEPFDTNLPNGGVTHLQLIESYATPETK